MENREETLTAEPEEAGRVLREETGIDKKSICQKNVSMLVLEGSA